MFKKKHYYKIESNIDIKDGKTVYYPVGHAFKALKDALTESKLDIELTIVTKDVAEDDCMSICLKGKTHLVEAVINEFYCKFHKAYSIAKQTSWSV